MLELRDHTFTNGYIERRSGGRYEGKVSIEGVDLSPIEATYFKENGKQYLWLKRKPMLEFDYESQSYRTRPCEPRWEAYLQKCGGGVVAYRGEFAFLRFRFSIVGVWDGVLAKDKERLNLIVERLPMTQQTIINAINDRNKGETRK